MKPKKLLCICNQLEDIDHFIKRFKLNTTDITVATDNIKVHYYIKKRFSYVNCIPIDLCKMEDMNHPRAIAVINEINEMLADRLPSNIKDIIAINPRVEGGVTSNAIHTLMVTFNIYYKLLQNNHDREVHIYYSPETYNDCNIAVCICKQLGIEFEIFNAKMGVKKSKFKRFTIGKKIVGIIIPYSLFIQLYRALVIFSSLKNKLIKLEVHDKKEKVLFLMRIGENRFIDDVESVVRELINQDVSGTLLFWNAPNGAKTAKERNLNSVNLENYLKLPDILSSLATSFKVYNQMKKMFDSNNTIEGISLDTEMRMVLKYFFKIEFLQTLLLQHATDNYLKNKKFIAIKVCVDNAVEWTKIVRRWYSDKRDAPIIFTWIQDGFVYKGLDFSGFDIFFGASQEQLININDHPNLSKILITPFKKNAIEGLTQIAENKAEREVAPIKILFAAGFIMKGVYSVYEISLMVEFLVEIAKKFDIEVWIKPHPSENQETINSIVDSCSPSNNVFVINSKENVNFYIKKSDLVITPFSTVVYETIVSKKPIIISYGGNRNTFSFMKQYFDFQDMISIEEIKDTLIELIKDKNYFIEWAKERVGWQNEIYDRIKDETQLEPPATAIAREILLKRKAYRSPS